jgi:predicted Fe-S protein YdhL (DUF1289 family)
VSISRFNGVTESNETVLCVVEAIESDNAYSYVTKFVIISFLAISNLFESQTWTWTTFDSSHQSSTSPRPILPIMSAMDYVPDTHANQQAILCAECGAVIEPNGANLCIGCLRNSVDISEGIPKEASINFCRGCERWFSPPGAWMTALPESRELLCEYTVVARTHGQGVVAD